MNRTKANQDLARTTTSAVSRKECIRAKTRLGPLRFVFGIALAALPGICSGAAFSLSPNTVSNLYPGNLTLQITGLTNGETVLLERFIDLNANSLIDSGESLVQSFRFTDGQVESLGGVRNGAVPGDDDLSANGQITTTVSFAYGSEFTRGSGNQIFRLSSPAGRFAAVQQTLTVTQSAFANQITGTVLSNGVAAPYSLAGVLVQLGNDNEFVSGAVADASGQFTLNVSNGTYSVIAFAPSCIGSFMTSPQVTVSGNNTNVTVPLSPGTFTVSGTITESSTGQALPAVQCFTTSGNNEYAVIFSDAAGHFNARVVNGQWKIDPSDYSAAMGGLMRSQNKVQVSVSGADVSGVSLSFTKETAMIYGTLKDDQNHALPGVRLFGGDSGNMFEASAFTDAGGNYFMPASAASWFVGGDNQNSGLPSGLILQGVQVAPGVGQALPTNLVAVHATAHLVGRAFDGNNNPIGSGSINANNSNFQNVNASLGSDGSFDLPVWGGNWNLSLESQTAASHNLVAPQLAFNVTDGNSISNINYVAPLATRTISGWVKNGGSVGISGLNVFANTTINGTNYNASGTTDSAGNYVLAVLPAVWNVAVDSQGLAQRGYGAVFNQNSDTTGGNQTLNFVVGAPPVGALNFRHVLGMPGHPAVGEFGSGATPVVMYPVGFKNYRAMFLVFNDTNPPTADTVLFTGPPGSGLTNTPGDTSFGAIQNGTNVLYFSPAVRSSSPAMGGNWTVTYRGNPNYLMVPDPQAWSRAVVPVPTITLSNNLLLSVHWSYKDMNGNNLPGTPSFIQNNRLDLFDQNGNGLDAEVFSATTSYTYPATNRYSWADISTLRVNYYDDLTNQYFVPFSSSSPSLTGLALGPGQHFQFLLNGPPMQNYTVQYSTNLSSGSWWTLYVTNSNTSPITILDPAPSSPVRFYRVLVGP